MRKTFILLFISCLIISAFVMSCSKSSDTNTTTIAVDSNFMINGISDMSLNSVNDTTGLTLTIVQTKTTQETVALSVKGLPTGATASFAPASGTTSFFSRLTISTTSAKDSTYKIQVVGTGPTGKGRSYDVNLILKPDCTNSLVGDYTNVTGTDAFTIAHIMRIDGTHITLFIASTPSKSITTTVNCGNNTLNIPLQQLQTLDSISGTGSYNTDSIAINYNYKLHNGSWTNCRTVIRH